MAGNDWLFRNGDNEVVVAEHAPFDTSDWYPDEPGQQRPVRYRLTNQTTGEIEHEVVFPLDPWSPADALQDRLHSLGWEDLSSAV